MEEIIRGDSINLVVTLATNGEVNEFQQGDIVKVGMKKFIDATNTYLLFKEIEIQDVCDGVQVIFLPEETKDIPLGNAVFEVELTYNNGASKKTIFEENVFVKGDVVI